MTGTLYLVATPIGNLNDITLRALQTLRESDIIACEDTRITAKLLAVHGLAGKRLLSYHAHNEFQRAQELVEKIERGASVAVVTDAGTPGVSDPASAVVRAAIEHGIPVVPIPGASAALGALVASGLITRRFAFEGFLPKKKGRKTFLESLKNEPRTLIIYESPQRVVKTLGDLRAALGNRRAAVARELTKIHEEFIRGTIAEIERTLAQRAAVKGECVIIVEGADGTIDDETS